MPDLRFKRLTRKSLQEIDANGKCGSVWKRDFTSCVLPTKDLKLNYQHIAHDHRIEEFIERVKEDNLENWRRHPLLAYEAVECGDFWINALVDKEKLTDSFRYLASDSQENELQIAEDFNGKIEVVLAAGKPTDGDETTAAGLYLGELGRMKLLTAEDDLRLNLTCPEQKLRSLVATLEQDDGLFMELCIELEAYKREDAAYDADKEPYLSWLKAPQDYLIEESQTCLLMSATFVKSLRQI